MISQAMARRVTADDRFRDLLAMCSSLFAALFFDTFRCMVGIALLVGSVVHSFCTVCASHTASKRLGLEGVVTP